MADLVLQHMNAQNRPFNAQNIADALGRHGIKKGPAQKHLDALADKGAINVKAWMAAASSPVPVCLVTHTPISTP
jgi:predicted ArsR family transcriptional regulator